MEAHHTDPFGSNDPFGPWTAETLLYWFIRLFVLTDLTSPQGAIRVNEETLSQSLAILDQEGKVIGGAFNETMPPFDVMPEFREDDPSPPSWSSWSRSSPCWARRTRRR